MTPQRARPIKGQLTSCRSSVDFSIELLVKLPFKGLIPRHTCRCASCTTATHDLLPTTTKTWLTLLATFPTAVAQTTRRQTIILKMSPVITMLRLRMKLVAPMLIVCPRLTCRPTFN
jgi:hypothetical protein